MASVKKQTLQVEVYSTGGFLLLASPYSAILSPGNAAGAMSG